MKNRNPVQEILRIRSRLSNEYRFSDSVIRLRQLKDAFQERRSVGGEFLNYFPVALVALLEGTLKQCAALLVDSGSPFLDNAAKKLGSSIKLDFDTVKAFLGKKVTVGEFVAHHLSWSNLGQVDSNLSSILDASFLDQLRTIKKRWQVEILGCPAGPILADPDDVFRKVSLVFEIRHVICHELATRFEFSLEDLEGIFPSCISFLDAAQELVNYTLSPDEPLTQSELTAAADSQLEGSLARLGGITEKIAGSAEGETREKWARVNEAWENYLKLAAEFEAASDMGGSIYPMTLSLVMKSLVEGRIDFLRQQYGSAESGDGEGSGCVR